MSRGPQIILRTASRRNMKIEDVLQNNREHYKAPVTEASSGFNVRAPMRRQVTASHGAKSILRGTSVCRMGTRGFIAANEGEQDWKDCVPGAWSRSDASAYVLHCSAVPLLGSLGDPLRLCRVHGTAWVQRVALHFACQEVFFLLIVQFN